MNFQALQALRNNTVPRRKDRIGRKITGVIVFLVVFRGERQPETDRKTLKALQLASYSVLTTIPIITIIGIVGGGAANRNRKEREGVTPFPFSETPKFFTDQKPKQEKMAIKVYHTQGTEYQNVPRREYTFVKKHKQVLKIPEEVQHHFVKNHK